MLPNENKTRLAQHRCVGRHLLTGARRRIGCVDLVDEEALVGEGPAPASPRGDLPGSGSAVCRGKHRTSPFVDTDQWTSDAGGPCLYQRAVRSTC